MKAWLLANIPVHEDLTLNVCKKKQLTNMRQSNRDIDVRLSPPRVMSLDEAIEYLANDELLEVTPAALTASASASSILRNAANRSRKTKELLETQIRLNSAVCNKFSCFQL